ncbi:hypothetical protein BI292_14525 [Pseudomonas sp. 43NM1]|uniref:hypothetical protein n=1 Tax=Pseudomonas sp. 43NM1 TaxID=1904755 RepID=UPI000CC15B6D|nr:hypothetical protein [Pseudomonas sp. 43NM1]PKH23096.1 hypothetical protein BI292_14525 [Pseudomonas sp. 43NM1]
MLFFRVALWFPLAALLILMLVEHGSGDGADLDFHQFLLIYVLSFGIPAYITFALWATRALSGISEQQIVKKIWCAPLMFIPFYAAPWVIGGLGFLLFGHLAGLGMMVMWVVFLPYLLVAGYVISGLTVAFYRTVFS